LKIIKETLITKEALKPTTVIMMSKKKKLEETA
jgi:hypothetical protein